MACCKEQIRQGEYTAQVMALSGSELISTAPHIHCLKQGQMHHPKQMKQTIFEMLLQLLKMF